MRTCTQLCTREWKWLFAGKIDSLICDGVDGFSGNE